MSPVKITGIMCINVTGEDYRYDVHQCHRWRLHVWFMLMSPVTITGMMCINVTGEDYRYDVDKCHRWRLQVWCTSMSPVKITGMMYINVTGENYRYDASLFVPQSEYTGKFHFYLCCRWGLQVQRVLTCVTGENYMHIARVTIENYRYVLCLSLSSVSADSVSTTSTMHMPQV